MAKPLFGLLADLHLQDTAYSTEPVPCDGFYVLKRAVEHTSALGIPLIIAGDLFNTLRPAHRHVVRVKRICDGHAVLGIDGNHDPASQEMIDKGKISWLDACDIPHLADHLEIGNFRIIGVDALERDGVEAAYRDACANADIVIGHQMLDLSLPEFAAAQSSANLQAAWCTGARAKAILLGDNHKRGTWDFGGVRFHYPGSARSTSQTEVGPRYFSIINNDLSIDAVTTYSRPFCVVSSDTEEVTEALLRGVVEDAYRSRGFNPAEMPDHLRKPLVIVRFAQKPSQEVSNLLTSLRDIAYFRQFKEASEVKLTERGEVISPTADVAERQRAVLGVVVERLRKDNPFWHPRAEEIALRIIRGLPVKEAICN